MHYIAVRTNIYDQPKYIVLYLNLIKLKMVEVRQMVQRMKSMASKSMSNLYHIIQHNMACRFVPYRI